MQARQLEMEVRLATFAFLDHQRRVSGEETVPWQVLVGGFDFRGDRVPVASQQGIFKPRILRLPLSIRTSPPKLGQPRPYEDDLGKDGIISYRYRGTDPSHHENAGLRSLWQQRVPLIYLFGILPGMYLPVYPAMIVGDEPAALTFHVQVEDSAHLLDLVTAPDLAAMTEGSAERRSYRTAAIQVRAHQQSFRARVLQAYQDHCAVCRLRHRELLDAAHIIPDGDPRGVAEVPNGLALCKLHHAAYDRNLIGVTPDLLIDVRADIRKETDGPMLRHGLQGTHGKRLYIPRRQDCKPNPDFLSVRYESFKEAAG